LLQQDVSVRNFLLTNIEEKAGQFCWRVNLDAVSNHLNDLFDFPQFETSFHGNCLFVGGASSSIIT